MDEECTIAELFHVLSGKWTLPVLYQLQLEEAPVRFGQLCRAVAGITTSELSKTLKLLESIGLVSRNQFNEIPVRVEYRRTELAASLREPLQILAGWLREHEREIIVAVPSKAKRSRVQPKSAP